MPDREALRCLLEPRSIAVVGASPRPGSFGERMASEVARSSAGVTVHYVNPGYGEVLGRSCIGSLDDIPGPVDLVLLGIGDTRLEMELARAAGRGDRSAVIFGNAYEAEVVGSPSLRERLARIARDASMELCGGGCMGFVNVAQEIRAIGYVEPDPIPAGPVALVTHSGSVFSAMVRARRGFGFSLAVSSGQEIVTTTASYLDYALSMAETKVVALVLETMREPAALRAQLTRAAANDVPVVVLPVGVSERGQSMVAAHSGAVAGGAAAWEALAEAHGLHLVADLNELVDTLELFAAGRRARRTGGGIAAVLDSGAERAMIVDVAAEVGVEFADLSATTMSALEARLDPGLIATNPLDVWGNGADTEGLFGDVLLTLADDSAVQAVALAVDLVVELDGDESYGLAVRRAAAASDVPVVVLSHLPSALDDATAAGLRADGIPVLEGTRSGLGALGHLLDHGSRPTNVSLEVDGARRDRWLPRLAAGSLSTVEGFALLADYGMATAPARSTDHAGAVLGAATSIGYPVVLKTDEAIAHKTDVDGVVVGLGNDDELMAAYREMAARLGPRVVVCGHVAPGPELLLGAVRDPNLGMVIVVGVGGVLVELVADRAAALPPLDAACGQRLLDRTIARRLLDAPRGGKPADLDAVVATIVGFGTLVHELGDGLDAIEINPLICSPAGAVAVDVHLEAIAEPVA